jgi:hypothetical protein
MTSPGRKRSGFPTPFAGPLWQATFIGLTLVLLSGSAWFAIVYRFGLSPEPPENPRRPKFAELWASVKDGAQLSAALDIMGPPDRRREQAEQVRDCACPCTLPCDTYHTCVVEYEWLSSLRAEAGDVYSLCADADGVVRRTSRGMQFQLNSAYAGGYAAAEVVGWAVLAFLLALPLSWALHAARRLWPKRVTRIE